jgi:hypothetical protein
MRCQRSWARPVPDSARRALPNGFNAGAGGAAHLLLPVCGVGPVSDVSGLSPARPRLPDPIYREAAHPVPIAFPRRVMSGGIAEHRFATDCLATLRFYRAEDRAPHPQNSSGIRTRITILEF